MKQFIRIEQTENGEFRTEFYPTPNANSLLVGIVLASATRVIAKAMIAYNGDSLTKAEDVENFIRAAYNADMDAGSLGETATPILKEAKV